MDVRLTNDGSKLTPEMILKAYQVGLFPMARSRYSDTILWFNPLKRGIIPLENFHIPRRLRRIVQKKPFDISYNIDFDSVVRECAKRYRDRPTTWINSALIRVYSTLHQNGFAHSVEARHKGQLVGGLYGVAMGGVFWGESMFSRETNASKITLIALVSVLQSCRFALLDTQFFSEHLRQFGAIEITRTEYLQRLFNALTIETQFGLHY